ncbi:helix-turn-helix transcriptional regulator [Shouchella tritolerans]|uniref:helix-turn-helix transcriptional regulator n=1 Tax=Shouchella tritolerans TaxID=2979466 RepID=UPI0021E9A362|nr:helix-turn-helix transcriptional regulator [Shouchella tritolerans]
MNKVKIRLKDPEQLKLILIKSGLSQSALAKKASTSPAYVNQILNGVKNPGPKMAKALADALDLGFDDIFFIESVS